MQHMYDLSLPRNKLSKKCYDTRSFSSFPTENAFNSQSRLNFGFIKCCNFDEIVNQNASKLPASLTSDEVLKF